MSALKDNPDHGSFLNDPLLGDSGNSTDDKSTGDDLLSEPKKEVDENPTKKDTGNQEIKEESEKSKDNASSTEEKKTKPKRKSEYDPYRVRDFLIRLAKAVKRHEIRSGAHQDLHEHIDKMRKTMASKRPKSDVSVDAQINELKNKVAEIIAIEKSHASPNSSHVKEKVNVLENKLNTLLESKQRKDERFKELEKKITTKYSADQELINKLEKKLLFLERKLIEHQLDKRKSKAKVDKKTVDDIKKQINKTKAILRQHKVEI